ncbi:MAG: methyltransferase domain-containing protein, partial [Pseudomonadota bacterium]
MTTTLDAFLGGQIQVEQPARGYRAGVDPVLLAAACPAKAGQSVLDLGCGVGTAALCLRARIGANIWGVELNPDYVALAQLNGQRLGGQFTVVCADVTARPTPFANISFDHVITNPPYFAGQPLAHDPGKAQGRGGAIDVGLWIGTAQKRLRPRGMLTLIQRMDRLPDVLRACSGFGDIQILPITA